MLVRNLSRRRIRDLRSGVAAVLLFWTCSASAGRPPSCDGLHTFRNSASAEKISRLSELEGRLAGTKPPTELSEEAAQARICARNRDEGLSCRIPGVVVDSGGGIAAVGRLPAGGYWVVDGIATREGGTEQSPMSSRVVRAADGVLHVRVRWHEPISQGCGDDPDCSPFANVNYHMVDWFFELGTGKSLVNVCATTSKEPRAMDVRVADGTVHVNGCRGTSWSRPLASLPTGSSTYSMCPTVGAYKPGAFRQALKDGRRLTRVRKFGAAITSFDRAVQVSSGMSPDEIARAYSGRGYAHLMAKRPEPAKQDLRRALELKPSPKLRGAIGYNLALAYEAQGQLGKAIAAAESSLTARPNHRATLRVLARLQAAQGARQ